MMLEVEVFNGKYKDFGEYNSLFQQFNGCVFEKVFFEFKVIFDVFVYCYVCFIGIGYYGGYIIEL